MGMAWHVMLFNAIKLESVAVAILQDPQTHKQAIKQPDTSNWAEAIELEPKQLYHLGVFKMKCTTDGDIDSYKSHLVSQRIHQTFDVDFFDKFAPVARLTSFRIKYENLL